MLAGIVLSGHMLWFHSPAWAVFLDQFSGKAAVMGFLLVSGFSIGASLERNETGFYRRRLLRIYPLYFFAILFAWSLELAFDGRMLLPNRDLQALGNTTAIGNLLLLQTFVVKPIQFDVPVWSLSIEVFFYFLAPWFARLDKRILLALIAISGVAFIAPNHDDWGTVYWLLTRFNALNYLWCWLLGFLVWRDRGIFTLAALGLGIPLVLFGAPTPEPLAIVTYLASAILVLSARRISIPKRLDSIGNYLGDLSYPLYLFHLPSFILAYGAWGVRDPLALVGVAFCTTLLAYYLIDVYLKPRYLKPLLFPRRQQPQFARDALPQKD